MGGQMENQLCQLFAMIDDNVIANGRRCYINPMYAKAESELRKTEGKVRLKAEADKQPEIDRNRAACREDMEKELGRIELKHNQTMAKMRQNHLREIRRNGNDF